VFPELKEKESEDERIKKAIIRILKGEICYTSKEDIDKYITWLEKQEEKNINHLDIKEKAHQIAWEASKNYDPSLSKESWCEMAALDMASWFEKQGEKKSADKVEPNPAWSEEDEEILKWLCRIIHSQRLSKEITLKEESELGEWMDKWLNHNPQAKQGEQLNPDKVIEWLKNTIRQKAENYGVYKETSLVLPYNSIEDLINDFKEDFGL
jgi:hypothetical protein